MGVIFRNRFFVYVVRGMVLYILVQYLSLLIFLPVHSSSLLFRSQSFSLLFVAFGLLAWQGAVVLARFIEKKTVKRIASVKVLFLAFGLFLYGLLTAYLFSLSYAVFDIILFGNYITWSRFSSFSYDLIFGLFMFYLLILAYNGMMFI